MFIYVRFRSLNPQLPEAVPCAMWIQLSFFFFLEGGCLYAPPIEHTQQMWMKNSRNACTFSFIHLGYVALTWRQEMLCSNPEIKCFPCSPPNASGHLSIFIEWIACFLHNKRGLYKLHINTDGFCLWHSLLLLCLKQSWVSLDSILLLLLEVSFKQQDKSTEISRCRYGTKKMHILCCSSFTIVKYIFTGYMLYKWVDQ